MKKNSLFLFLLMLVFFINNGLINAQGTLARQVIIANGGKFETSPPYTDYVTIETYNLSTLAVTVFNTIYTQSVQDVLVYQNHAYVTAQDSIVLYNIDTFHRIAAVADSGINKMAIYNGKLIVTKQYPVTRFHVEVLDANTLGLIQLVDGIPGDCEGVAIYGTRAYVAVDSGYAGTNGRLAVINTSNWTVDTILNLGTPAVGIYNVYTYGNHIYTVNKTPYGGGNVGSITKLNPVTGSYTTNTIDVNVGPGYGIKGNLLYLGMNHSIGSYNMTTLAIVDTTIIAYTGSGGNIEINSAAVDSVDSKFYTNIGNRTSLGLGVVFSLTGDSLTSYQTGLNADACGIDYRLPTGFANNGSVQNGITVYPNPVTDIISISTNSSSFLKDVKILDLTGRTLENLPVQPGENNIRLNVSDFPAGVYLISFTTDQSTKVRKFIKR
jgi:hypothetical protein